MNKLANARPGETLLEEFLKTREITGHSLSKSKGIHQNRRGQIIEGKRGVTADNALRLSKYFGTSPKFWLGPQVDYDLERKTNKLENGLKQIKILNSVRVKNTMYEVFHRPS